MKHPFEQSLLYSFINLPGGQYGTLDVTAIDRGHLELALGGADFVWMTKAEWVALRRVADKFFGLVDTLSETDTVIATTDEDGEPVVLEEHTESVDVEPHRARRRRN